MVETVLSQQFDDLEPTLTRHGYHITDLVQQFDAKPTEIKALFTTSSIHPYRGLTGSDVAGGPPAVSPFSCR